MTIIVHHLENSRSQLEELGLPYEIKRYERDRKTMLAPPELKLSTKQRPRRPGDI